MAHLPTVRGRDASRTRKAVTIVHHHHLTSMLAQKLDQCSGKLPGRNDLDGAEDRALSICLRSLTSVDQTNCATHNALDKATAGGKTENPHRVQEKVQDGKDDAPRDDARN